MKIIPFLFCGRHFAEKGEKTKTHSNYVNLFVKLLCKFVFDKAATSEIAKTR